MITLLDHTTSDPQPVEIARIPDDQRAALAWRLRNMLAAADRCAAAWRRPSLSELARSESLRVSALELIVELEGGRPGAAGERRS